MEEKEEEQIEMKVKDKSVRGLSCPGWRTDCIPGGPFTCTWREGSLPGAPAAGFRPS